MTWKSLLPGADIIGVSSHTCHFDLLSNILEMELLIKPTILALLDILIVTVD